MSTRSESLEKHDLKEVLKSKVENMYPLPVSTSKEERMKTCNCM
jgi:hypothetical protein